MTDDRISDERLKEFINATRIQSQKMSWYADLLSALHELADLRRQLAAATAQLKLAHADLDEARRDAEDAKRYRWLNKQYSFMYIDLDDYVDRRIAIDAAREQGEK